MTPILMVFFFPIFVPMSPAGMAKMRKLSEMKDSVRVASDGLIPGS